jgi:stringent starvation protein B
VLTVTPPAPRAHPLGNAAVTYAPRFGGVSQPIAVPLAAGLGISARETGPGMNFGEDDSPTTTPESDGPAPKPPRPSGDRRPKLKVIK